MPPAIRPSDVYGPPGSTQSPVEEPSATPSRTRVPSWLVPAGLLVLAALALGVVIAPDELTSDGVSPALVDVVSEDQAIAALGLYGAQVEAASALQPDGSVFAQPGADVIWRTSRSALHTVSTRLSDARDQPMPDPTVAAYWSSTSHDALLRALDERVEDVRLLSLLEATHGTLYDGAGQVDLVQVRQELLSRTDTGMASGPLARWAGALLDELDGADRFSVALQARADTEAWWHEHVAAIGPVESEVLASYIAGLPPSTVRGLEGHPVTGPALTHLRSVHPGLD